MTAIEAQYDLPALLEQSGARPRGNRHDCPKCGGFRTVTHTAECFFCHKCQWKGNTVTLAKELGVYRRLPSAEWRELRQNRERADRAAQRLYAAVHDQRTEFLQHLEALADLERTAHDAGPTEAAWDALAMVYADRPEILAQLAILETASAADLLTFLSASPEERQRAIEAVILRGGLCDSGGRFVDLGN